MVPKHQKLCIHWMSRKKEEEPNARRPITTCASCLIETPSAEYRQNVWIYFMFTHMHDAIYVPHVDCKVVFRLSSQSKFPHQAVQRRVMTKTQNGRPSLRNTEHGMKVGSFPPAVRKRQHC